MLLPFRPKPLHDELFSSWLRRVATGNSGKVQTFCHLLWPGRQIWNRDIDLIDSYELISSLAYKTGCADEAARKTSLRSLTGIVFERSFSYRQTRWILPLGIYHRIYKRAGLQWCPQCLSEDTEPYFRKAWRLSFSTSCLDHKIIIADRCHECQIPATPHRGNPLVCHHCGTDRRKYPRLLADPHVIALERDITDAINNPSRAITFYESSNCLMYLNLIRQCASILSTNPRSEKLRFVICKKINTNHENFEFSRKLRSIEDLSVQARHILMRLSAALLEKWPDSLIDSCLEAKMWPSWALRGNMKVMPRPYIDAISQLKHR